MKIDKTKLRDDRGHPLTQSLFLEIGYNTQFAVYTLKEEDFEYEGKVYPSLKRLYLECEDPTEYNFAKTYLLSWSHWKRLLENKALKKYFDEWRDELEYKLRSQAIRDIIGMSANESGGFQAAKWLADRGWDKRAAGRPSKKEKEAEDNINNRLAEEFKADIVRLKAVEK
jgi:hypothetical protein